MFEQKRPLVPYLLLKAAALAVILVVFLPFSSGQEAKGSVREDAVNRLRALLPESARTRICVLATFHLTHVAETFKPDMLDGLVDRLAAFRPDAICVETLPGSRVQELELRRDAGPMYPEILDGFAARHLTMGKRAMEILGSTPQAAAAKVRELLAAARTLRPRSMTPSGRAGLALWMLAAYDPASAALQWSYLSDSDKKAQHEIPPDLAESLAGAASRINEVPALAARLARRLGLEKLDAVDDFEDLDAFAEIQSQLEMDFQGNPLLAAVSKARIYADADGRLAECVRKGDLLPQYVFLNSPEYARADVDAQWGVFLRTRFASGTDRSRLGLWENRNLKIAARIRTVAALHPSGRILVIYGAAHKPFLEAYLSRLADVELMELPER